MIGRRPVEISDLAYDTRSREAGTLFFCVPGANRDGHELATEAVASGAVALVVERPLEASVPSSSSSACARRWRSRRTRSSAAAENLTSRGDGDEREVDDHVLLRSILEADGRRRVSWERGQLSAMRSKPKRP